MNDKLSAWKSWAVAPQKRGYPHAPSEALVSLLASKESAKPTVARIGVSLHPRAVKQLGWLHGDTVALEYVAGIVYLFRHPNGRVLSKPKNTGIRSYVRFAVPPAHANLFRGKYAGEVEIADGKLAFVLEDAAE